MKQAFYIELLVMFLSSIAALGQTPFDAFAPEKSRVILDADSIAAWKAQQKADTFYCAIVADLHKEELLLVDIQSREVLAYAPFTEEIKKWMTVDPLADKYISTSPYLYCNGNPIMLVDPDGRYSVNKISKGPQKAGRATYESADKWLKTHDPTGASSTLYIAFHFMQNATPAQISNKIKDFSIEMADWRLKFDSGDLGNSPNDIKHVVIQACYGAQVAEELARKNPGIYVSGASGLLAARKTQTGYRNVSNKETISEKFLIFFTRKKVIDGQWNTYYCDPKTGKLKVWKKTQAEPPVLYKKIENE